MALKVGHAIASGIFDLKETEEPFHPWWEKLQDYICYSILILGNKIFKNFLLMTLVYFAYFFKSIRTSLVSA